MTKFFITTIITVLFITLLTAASALSADKLVVSKIASVTEGTASNGNAYIRINITDDRVVQGIKYSVEVPLMVFGEELLTYARTLKAGDSVKAICRVRNRGGRTSYTAIQFIK